jgi:hypothetical protein
MTTGTTRIQTTSAGSTMTRMTMGTARIQITSVGSKTPLPPPETKKATTTTSVFRTTQSFPSWNWTTMPPLPLPPTTRESWGDPLPRMSHLPTWLHMPAPLVLTSAVHKAPQAIHSTTTHPPNDHRLLTTSFSAYPRPSAQPPLATSTLRRPNYTIKLPSPPILIAWAGRYPSSLALTLTPSSPISTSCIMM